MKIATTCILIYISVFSVIAQDISIVQKEKWANQYMKRELTVSEGLAMISLNQKWGYVDSTGTPIIPIIYDDIGGFNHGVSPVAKAQKWGLINKKGVVVVPLIYDQVRVLSKGLAVVTKFDSLQILGSQNHNVLEKKGLIDFSGNEITPVKYANILHENFEGVLRVKSFNLNDYDSSYRYTREELGNGKWGLIDAEGKELAPNIYTRMGEFSEGLVQVNLGGTVKPSNYLKVEGGLWGYIDATGTVVIPIQYENAYPFLNGRAKVQLEGETFEIDKTGAR